ncbi:MAG: hypothetical protein LBS01_02570 [Prevotellaceae bacterium]|jgi:hypothetical protein|nr:hypothetical protein [Prevotellaceae bacterium]
MLHDKNTEIISELKNYFSSNEKIFQTLFSELRSLKISDKFFVSVDKINTKYVGYQRFMLLTLFPLFYLKHIYEKSAGNSVKISTLSQNIFLQNGQKRQKR